MPEPTHFYLLVCRVCDPQCKEPIPFESPRARGEWATAHAKGTGHRDAWWVCDLPRDPGAPVADERG